MPEIIRIGGVQYNWNSTVSRVDGQPYRGIKSVDWSQKLERETVYSQTQDGVPIGPTGGQYSVDAFTFKMLWEYWEQLKLYLATVAPGAPPGNRGIPGTYGQTGFYFNAQASEPLQIGALPIILTAGECYVTSEKETHEEGTAALVVEIGLWVRQLTINGLTMYNRTIPTP